MGLFSKIKKGVSKAWGGVKGAVKTVARTVKKVAKKVAYATPLGKKLWDFSSKIGKGVMKGIGKITSKLGPVGMMALSFVLAPVMGPMIGALWSGFGAGAAAMAGSANMFVSALGTVGNGIFAAGNFAAGTLGALGNAVTEGASQVLQGNFSAAANAFATNVSSAFSGQAGMASVNAGAAQAAKAAGQLAAGPTPAPTGSPSMDWSPDNIGLGEVNTGIPDPFDVTKLNGPTLMETQAQQGVFGKEIGKMSLTDMDAFNKFGSAGVQAINASAPAGQSTTDTLKKVVDNAQQMKDMIGGGQQEGIAEPFKAKALQSIQVAKASNVAGQGSAGFSLLGGVQGLEESVRRSQQLMFS